MRALITGVEGFVGSHLAKELKSKGYEVAGTYLNECTLNIKKYHVDILEPREIEKCLVDYKPHLIFHLAAISNVKLSMEKPELTFRVNVEGTKNILERTKAKVLLIGSATEYGIPKKLPITEDHPLNPGTPYAKSKVECEKLAKKYPGVFVVRSFNHIGPGQTEDFVASAFAKQIVEIENGEKDTIKVGNLEAKRDFTDVRDIVRAYVLAMERGRPHTPYNICSGTAISIKELLDRLLSLSTAEVKIEKDPQRMRPSDIPILLGDNTRFCSATGWKPEIPLGSTLNDIMKYWRAKYKYP